MATVFVHNATNQTLTLACHWVEESKKEKVDKKEVIGPFDSGHIRRPSKPIASWELNLEKPFGLPDNTPKVICTNQVVNGTQEKHCCFEYKYDKDKNPIDISYKFKEDSDLKEFIAEIKDLYNVYNSIMDLNDKRSIVICKLLMLAYKKGAQKNGNTNLKTYCLPPAVGFFIPQLQEQSQNFTGREIK